MRILRPSLSLGSCAAKTAHPAGKPSPRDAGPSSPGAWTPPAARLACVTVPASPASRNPPAPASPPTRATPGAPRRVPVPAAWQQDLAQMRTQLPHRRLRFGHLQRTGPLLEPDPQLHGGGRAQGPGPEAAATSGDAGMLPCSRRRPRHGGRPTGRPHEPERSAPLEGAPCSPPRKRAASGAARDLRSMTRHATAPPGNERSTSAQALRLRRCAGVPAAVPRRLCPLLPGVPGGINAERDVAATTTRRSVRRKCACFLPHFLRAAQLQWHCSVKP